ncbi:MAG: hypothetical protein IK999_08660 [Ruminococcus sp.]|nr:hypothetical protein [Ruminococcus sp.]
MEYFNQAKTNIQITSYENGELFTTEQIVFGEIGDKDICDLCKRHDFIRNAAEHKSSRCSHDNRAYKIGVGDSELYDDSVNDDDTMENIAGEDKELCCEFYEEEDALEVEIEKMSDDLHGMKKAGAVILAAQLLLSLGFFCFHHKMVHGNKAVK